MKYARLLVAAVVLLALGGCSGRGESLFSTAFSSTAEAEVKPALLPYTVTCTAGTFALTRCVIPVKATYDVGTKMCKAEAPNVILEKPGVKRFILIWTPPSNVDYSFCPLLGDRVELTKKDPARPDGSFDEQFDNAWAVDDPTSVGSDNPGWKKKACFAKYRMLAENIKPQVEYDYTIRFRHSSGAECKHDPFVKNG